jgi:four helix bundle protein
MNFENWHKIPNEIKKDAVWSLKVYRIALFIPDLSWIDIKPILDQNLFSLSDQRYRSTGSIGANITEGYSRHSHKEHARFRETALQSAREAKDWNFKSRHILADETAFHRNKILTATAKLLLTMINERRTSHKTNEENVKYSLSPIKSVFSVVPITEYPTLHSITYNVFSIMNNIFLISTTVR